MARIDPGGLVGEPASVGPILPLSCRPGLFQQFLALPNLILGGPDHENGLGVGRHLVEGDLEFLLGGTGTVLGEQLLGLLNVLVGSQRLGLGQRRAVTAVLGVLGDGLAEGSGGPVIFAGQHKLLAFAVLLGARAPGEQNQGGCQAEPSGHAGKLSQLHS